ncbi:phosphotransferase KptA/Tpt1 [Infundibulicybe gibba]|nr:phosphotransferase KptA/Tpt1 [Infundibulicybe gibba]
MRPDGYIKVVDLLSNPKIKSTGLDLEGLQHIVKDNAKKRFELVFESDASAPEGGAWWIRASQGHSINARLLTVEVEYQPIKSLADIPSGIAVHGTNLRAWNLISKEGLSKMARNHIHLAQGVAGENVISGMRSSSQILIFIDVEKALSSGIEFFLSANGVVLTKGDERGFLSPTFFQRVENASRVACPAGGFGFLGKRLALVILICPLAT